MINWKGLRAMSNKRIRLPKDGLIEPEQRTGPGERFIDETDVEGHSWVSPAPPAEFTKRSPSHGGELTPTEDDLEGGPR